MDVCLHAGTDISFLEMKPECVSCVAWRFLQGEENFNRDVACDVFSVE